MSIRKALILNIVNPRRISIRNMNNIKLPEPYEYKGSGYMGMKKEMPELPTSVQIGDAELIPRTSFHTTLVCLKDIQRRLDNDWGVEKESEEVAIKTLQIFQDFITKERIEFLGLRDELRFVERGEKKSLIVMCDVSNIGNLFARLSREFKIDIPAQPTHITLYTLQPNIGIAISDQAELEETTLVNSDKLLEVRHVLGLC